MASRPQMPGYGIAPTAEGLLPWSWAVERLRDSHIYWLSTVNADSTPHAMAVWGVWLDDCFYFSSGARSRKARNLAARPHCVVATRAGHGEAILVVEGVATPVTDPSLRAGCEASYGAKYPESIPPGEPVYAVEPRVVFGLGEEPFTETATRWVFPT